MGKVLLKYFLFSLLFIGNAFTASSEVGNDDCKALLNPHLTIAKILPALSDDEALMMLKQNYSELLTWLTQKADATAEGGDKPGKGDYGPNHNLTPSMFLFGKDIVEVNRTAIGVLAIKWILAGDYSRFSGNQPAPMRLSPESFQDLQSYVKSVLKTPEDIDAMIVMILTNDLGKIKRYHELTEKAVARAIVDHDELLFVGFKEWSETAPNFHRLSQENKTKIIDGLQMGSNLNVGQFAQAENLPANLEGVLALTGKPEAFEFKFIELLLDVAGAQGHIDASGAKVMMEPVFKNYMLARKALLEVVAGGSLRSSYDQILIQKSLFLSQSGFRRLSVTEPMERAVLRLLTLRRTTSVSQAEELFQVFESLPPNARTILISELNVDGVQDGWGTLPYYAPAFIDNALKSLGPDRSAEALRTVFLSLARTFQEARIHLKSRKGNGVFTVNVEKLAKYVQTDEYKTNPQSLLAQEYELVSNSGDINQFFVRLSPLPKINPASFAKYSNLADLPGSRILVVGIGGGSDAVQAALVGKIAQSSGKKIAGVLSFRTLKIGSQGSSGALGEERKYEGATAVAEGILHIHEKTTGTGRVLEPIIAKEFPTYLVLDDGTESINSRIKNALALFGSEAIDTVLLVDTGGDSLYPVSSAEAESSNSSKTTPDQDLRVLQAFQKVGVSLAAPAPTFISVVVAAGVDSPADAEQTLARAHAIYYNFKEDESWLITRQYEQWQMTGTHPDRYGKTPFAWQAALAGDTGITVIPLPSQVVLDHANPWNPFVRVPVPGIFFMDLNRHLMVIQSSGKN